MRWRIFYADGTVEGYGTASPEAVPKTGIIAIVHDTPSGPRIQHRKDFYWWTGDRDYGWYGGDVFGLWEQLTQRGSHIVLFGRSIPDALYREVIDSAARLKEEWRRA